MNVASNLRALAWDLYYWIFRRGDYSQFGEQKLLESAIGDLGEIGAYLDLGCHSPIKCSNTYFLYRKGWRGISVDANSDFGWLWGMFRSRDIFVAKAVAAEDVSTITFYKFDSKRSLVSTTDQSTALQWRAKFGGEFHEVTVRATSMGELVAEMRNQSRNLSLPFRLMSVDLEGVDERLVSDWLNSGPSFMPEFMLIESHQKAPTLKGFKLLGQAGPSYLYQRD